MGAKDAVKTLRRELIKVNVLQSALDSVALFLTLNLISKVFNLSLRIQILAFVALGFGLVDLSLRLRRNSLDVFESENPHLDEILETARDNLDVENRVVHHMAEDLETRISQTDSDTVVPLTRILAKIGLIAALSLSTVLSATVEVDVNAPDLPDAQNIVPQTQEEANILGNSSEVSVSGTDLEIEVQGSGSSKSEVNIDSGGEIGSADVDPGSLDDRDLAIEYSLAIRSGS